jgi:hypothetical protein
MYLCGHDDGIGDTNIGNYTIKITPFKKCKECQEFKEVEK